MIRKLTLAILIGAALVTAACSITTSHAQTPNIIAAAYDVGPGVDGQWCEYATIEDLIVAMTNQAVNPCGAYHFQDGGDGHPGYWVEAGMDPLYIGYPVDTTGFDGLPSYRWEAK